MISIEAETNRVREIRAVVAEITARLPKLTPDREEVLGLEYKKGDRVKDERTGKEYTVIAGTRKSVTVQAPGS
jgi:hypothetical protein